MGKWYALMALWIVVALGFWGAMIYIAIHFIGKFW